MTDDPKDPNAKSPVRRPEISGALYDRNDLSNFLTNKEWDELWDKMTERRKEEIANEKNEPWLFTMQPDPEYKKMVEALLGARENWGYWQEEEEQQAGKRLLAIFYDFQYLDFVHEIHLYGATFNKQVIFSNATFAKDANFLDITFAKGANFAGAKFTNRASFWDAIFTEGAAFWGATFSDYAVFKNAKFNKEVSFQNAKFNKEVSFAGAEFAKYAVFFEAGFAEEANFNQARFQSSGFFNKAKFDGDEINFGQMILSADSNLVFENAKFKNAVPDFRYLNRIPDIPFHGFSVPSPDELIKKNKWQEGNEDRYRQLKKLAIGNDNHEYELKFYGYEMDSKLRNFEKAKEKKIGNKKCWIFCNKIWWGFYGTIKKIFYNINQWIDILLTMLYKWVSNYGESFVLPLFWLVVLLGACYIGKLDSSHIVKTISPLPLYADQFGGNISSFWLFIKIPATIFLFLFFLAVRNKFKIK